MGRRYTSQTEEQFQASINSMTEADLPDTTPYEGLTEEDVNVMDFNSKSKEYLEGLNFYLATKVKRPYLMTTKNAIDDAIQNKHEQRFIIKGKKLFDSKEKVLVDISMFIGVATIKEVRDNLNDPEGELINQYFKGTFV